MATCNEYIGDGKILTHFGYENAGKKTKVTDADINSKIGAELTSLFNAYSSDPSNLNGATDDMFQLDSTKLLIELVVYIKVTNIMCPNFV